MIMVPNIFSKHLTISWFSRSKKSRVVSGFLISNLYNTRQRANNEIYELLMKLKNIYYSTEIHRFIVSFWVIGVKAGMLQSSMVAEELPYTAIRLKMRISIYGMLALEFCPCVTTITRATQNLILLLGV